MDDATNMGGTGDGVSGDAELLELLPGLAADVDHARAVASLQLAADDRLAVRRLARAAELLQVQFGKLGEGAEFYSDKCEALTARVAELEAALVGMRGERDDERVIAQEHEARADAAEERVVELEAERAKVPAAVAYVFRGDRILSVTRRGTDERSAPGGKLDPGETPEQAARRELREETGLVATSARLVYAAHGPSRRLVHAFLVTVDDAAEPVAVEDGTRVEWVAPEVLAASFAPEFHREGIAAAEQARAEPSGMGAIVAEVVHVACFTEDEFADVEHFATAEEARAFASGYTSGAGEYGAGSCAAYVLPAQDHEMRAVEKEREWKKAIAAIEACDAKGGAS